MGTPPGGCPWWPWESEDSDHTRLSSGVSGVVSSLGTSGESKPQWRDTPVANLGVCFTPWWSQRSFWFRRATTQGSGSDIEKCHLASSQRNANPLTWRTQRPAHLSSFGSPSACDITQFKQSCGRPQEDRPKVGETPPDVESPENSIGPTEESLQCSDPLCSSDQGNIRTTENQPMSSGQLGSVQPAPRTTTPSA